MKIFLGGCEDITNQHEGGIIHMSGNLVVIFDGISGDLASRLDPGPGSGPEHW